MIARPLAAAVLTLGGLALWIVAAGPPIAANAAFPRQVERLMSARFQLSSGAHPDFGASNDVDSAAGTVWESVQVPVAGVLSDVAPVSESEVWAVSMGASDLPAEVLRYRRGGWQILYARPDTYLWSISMVTADDGWAAGFETRGAMRSVLLPIRRGTVEAAAVSACTTLIAVHMLDSETGWAGGNSVEGGVSTSCILLYSGGAWVRQRSPGDALVVAFAMTGPTTGWALGSEGELLRLAGGRWEEVASPVPANHELYYDMSLAAPDDGWAVGIDSHAALRLEGETWRLSDIGDEVSLFGVDMVAPDLGWATGMRAGDAPALMRFDGRGWASQDLPADVTTPLMRVDMRSARSGWAVGGPAALRRLDVPDPTATSTEVPSATPTSEPATSTVTAVPSVQPKRAAFLPFLPRD